MLRRVVLRLMSSGIFITGSNASRQFDGNCGGKLPGRTLRAKQKRQVLGCKYLPPPLLVVF
jgi:hypothetical protein